MEVSNQPEDRELITLEQAVRSMQDLIIPDATPEQRDRIAAVSAAALREHLGEPMPPETSKEVSRQIRAILYPDQPESSASNS